MTFAERHYAARGWVLALLFAALAGARHFSDRELRPEALLLVAAGAVYRLWAAHYISDHSNGGRLTGVPLATGGPYAWGRHPLYLANIVIACGLIGFANCLSPWAVAALLALIAVHHAALAAAEERQLASEAGEAYHRYRQVTPMWLGWRRGKGWRGRGREPGGGGFALAWRRQAANLGKSALCAVVLWMLA